MNVPENNQTEKPADEPEPRPAGIPGEKALGEPNLPASSRNGFAAETKPRVKTSDIYSVIEKAELVGPMLIQKIFGMLAEMEDPAPIVASLLRDFMDGIKPKAWGKLREHDMPAMLFEKLCATVGVPGLGAAWKHMGRDAAPEIYDLLREYVPPSREAADSFLLERSMLPLSILIYRAFRNDEVALGRVIRDWLAPIAAGCDDQRQNIQKEAQRTAKWLIDLSSKRQNRGDFLAAVAPALVSIRLGRAAFDEVSAQVLQRTHLESELKRAEDECELLRGQAAELTTSLNARDADVLAKEEKIKRLEETLEFGATRATNAAIQAAGAMKEQLKNQVIQRVEDARLFLDRSEPKVAVALELLEQIQQQFE
jgi:hypothetical protein